MDEQMDGAEAAALARVHALLERWKQEADADSEWYAMVIISELESALDGEELPL